MENYMCLVRSASCDFSEKCLTNPDAHNYCAFSVGRKTFFCFRSG